MTSRTFTLFLRKCRWIIWWAPPPCEFFHLMIFCCFEFLYCGFLGSVSSVFHCLVVSSWFPCLGGSCLVLFRIIIICDQNFRDVSFWVSCGCCVVCISGLMGPRFLWALWLLRPVFWVHLGCHFCMFLCVIFFLWESLISYASYSRTLIHYVTVFCESSFPARSLCFVSSSCIVGSCEVGQFDTKSRLQVRVDCASSALSPASWGGGGAS